MTISNLMKMEESYSELLENTVGKGEIAHYEQFLLFHSVFKRLVLQTRKNPGLVWERVKTLAGILIVYIVNLKRVERHACLLFCRYSAYELTS